MDTKNWNVHVVREGSAVEIGQVNEKTAVLARCAALARFGLGEYQVEIGGVRPRGAAIYPDENFEVSLES